MFVMESGIKWNVKKSLNLSLWRINYKCCKSRQDRKWRFYNVDIWRMNIIKSIQLIIISERGPSELTHKVGADDCVHANFSDN